MQLFEQDITPEDPDNTYIYFAPIAIADKKVLTRIPWSKKNDITTKPLSQHIMYLLVKTVQTRLELTKAKDQDATCFIMVAIEPTEKENELMLRMGFFTVLDGNMIVTWSTSIESSQLNDAVLDEFIVGMGGSLIPPAPPPPARKPTPPPAAKPPKNLDQFNRDYRKFPFVGPHPTLTFSTTSVPAETSDVGGHTTLNP